MPTARPATPNSISKRIGSSSAEEIYLAMGEALSWWETAEDFMSALLLNLVRPPSPLALEYFRKGAKRSERTRALKAALRERGSAFSPQQVTIIQRAIDDLNKLAATRNQIAHGNCAHLDIRIEQEAVLEGFFLRSAMTPDGHFLTPEANPAGMFERAPKYLFSADDIRRFADDVRRPRGEIMDAILHLFQKRIEDDAAARAARL